MDLESPKPDPVPDPRPPDPNPFPPPRPPIPDPQPPPNPPDRPPIPQLFIPDRRDEARYVFKHISVVMMSVILLFTAESAFSADVPCRFKANSESVEVQIVVGGKEYWHGTIQRDETQHVSIPEGPFTLVSKMYNPNLRTYEDVRTETHTRVCLERTALSVPLFADH